MTKKNTQRKCPEENMSKAWQKKKKEMKEAKSDIVPERIR